MALRKECQILHLQRWGGDFTSEGGFLPNSAGSHVARDTPRARKERRASFSGTHARVFMKKVLVIDDNPTIVELIKYAVNLQGSYQVIVAYDGVQGLERIFAEQPDCVIIDVKMPRMDGYQLVRCLRGDPRTANTPLIILSAMTREEDQVTGLLSGADEYLTKPFKPTALNAAIERVLRLTPGERQNRTDYLVQTQAERD
jgi:CheY-like chemotaxis protein